MKMPIKSYRLKPVQVTVNEKFICQCIGGSHEIPTNRKSDVEKIRNKRKKKKLRK